MAAARGIALEDKSERGEGPESERLKVQEVTVSQPERGVGNVEGWCPRVCRREEGNATAPAVSVSRETVEGRSALLRV